MERKKFMKTTLDEKEDLKEDQKMICEDDLPLRNIPLDAEYSFLAVEKLSSIDDLYERFNSGYYHSLDRLEADLELLISNVKI